MMTPYRATELDTVEDVVGSVEAKLSRMVLSTTLALTEAIGAYYGTDGVRQLAESLDAVQPRHGERSRCR